MKLVRKPLPETRKRKLTKQLRNRVWATINPRNGRMLVSLGHSRWVWWKFYRDDK